MFFLILLLILGLLLIMVISWLERSSENEASFRYEPKGFQLGLRCGIVLMLIYTSIQYILLFLLYKS